MTAKERQLDAMTHPWPATGRETADPSAKNSFGMYEEFLSASMSAGLLGANLRGLVTFVNPVACHLLGYEAEDLIGQDIHGLVHHQHPDGRPYPREECPVAAAISEGRAVRGSDQVFWRRDGRPLRVIYSTQPLIEDGRVSGGILSFLDLDAARRTGEQQREREAQLATAQKIARLGSWHVRLGANDSEDEWTLSDELNQMYDHPEGFSVETETGFQIMPEEERESIRQIWEAAKNGTGPTEWGHRIVINGQMRWMHVRARFIRDSQGRATEAYGINQDITERKTIELARRASEELTHGIMESMHHRIAVIDTEGIIIRTNRAWSRFALENGASLATANGVGLNYFAICATAGEDPWAHTSMKGMRAVLAGDVSEFSLEYPCHGPGAQRWFLLQVAPLGEDIRGLVVTHVDITIHKLAELAVASAERQIRTIVDAMPGLVGYVDQTMSYHFNNRLYEDWFGLSPENLKGRTIAQVLGAEYYEQARPWLEKALKGERVSFESRVTDRHGVQRILQVTYVPELDDQSVVKGAFILALDISEQKQTQAALSALGSEMNALLEHQIATQTAAILAHELNQPLNAASTFCEAALRLFQLNHPGDERTGVIVRRATEEIQRAGDVVRRLLKTLQGGEPPLEILDLAEVLEEATDLFMAEASSADILLELQHPIEPLPILANRLQLEKVLINLLRNAREAVIGTRLPLSPTICIRATHINQQAVISVIDNGPGIAPAIRHRLFEAFFTTKPHGIGMGLNVSQAIVERLGGQLWHEPQDPGTAFHFSIPIAP